MATKRFTDTEKWKDPFFDELTNDYKLVWLYLLDDCDNAGVFSVNLRRLNFTCNVDLTKDDILLTFGNRLHAISEDRWLIPSFMLFQYGPKWDTSESKAVVSARKKLEALGLSLNDNRVLLESKSSTNSVSIDNQDTTNRLSIDYKETIDSIKDKDKDENKSKDQDKNKSKDINKDKLTYEDYVKTLTKEEKEYIKNLPDKDRQNIANQSTDEEKIQFTKYELLKSI